jgi:hypothetical protein
MIDIIKNMRRSMCINKVNYTQPVYMLSEPQEYYSWPFLKINPRRFCVYLECVPHELLHYYEYENASRWEKYAP